jgi:SAM-dependent methyltransferase
MNLNLGCGDFKFDDCINVDKSSKYDPDVLHDLEVFPWPFESNSVDNIILCHVLEHLGQSTDVFFKIIKELYRVAKHDCVLHIDVPCPRSKYYLIDPTHVRPITPELFSLFDKHLNKYYAEHGLPMSQFGIEYDVDFKLVGLNLTVNKEIYEKAECFKYYNHDHNVTPNALVLPNVPEDAYHELSGYHCNMVKNMNIIVRCNKPNDCN